MRSWSHHLITFLAPLVMWSRSHSGQECFFRLYLHMYIYIHIPQVMKSRCHSGQALFNACKCKHFNDEILISSVVVQEIRWRDDHLMWSQRCEPGGRGPILENHPQNWLILGVGAQSSVGVSLGCKTCDDVMRSRSHPLMWSKTCHLIIWSHLLQSHHISHVMREVCSSAREVHLFLQVSFAEYSLFYRALFQKRPTIWRSLLIVHLFKQSDGMGWLRWVGSLKL